MRTSHRFERFEILPEQRQLLVNGQPVVLGARAFDLLLCLVELRDRVVGKDKLMARVWPGLVVEENNLTVQISALRKLLGGDAIATVVGRGYRFTLPALDGAEGDSSPVGALLPPTPTAPTTAPHNLPTERSSFIGREQEISAVRQAVGQHRLVTLTGVGGSGKTRLALRVGALELGRFADGTFFVDLGPLSDAELVSTAMWRALAACAARGLVCRVLQRPTGWSRP